MSSIMRTAAVPFAAALVGASVLASPAGAEGGGRTLDGHYCTNAQAMPKPGACIALSSDGTTAQGYADSANRVLSLRPGNYWLTVDDTSTAHNFSLADPSGADQDLTTVPGTGSVTVKVHLTHGTWVLFCEPHRAMGMYVDIEVGGEGQVG